MRHASRRSPTSTRRSGRSRDWSSPSSGRTRSSSWRRASSSATPNGDEGSEILSEDRAGIEGAHEALDLVSHVGAHQALVVTRQHVGAAVQLLVEELDVVLAEDALAEHVAVGAVEHHAPVLRSRLLPLDGIDELGVALDADVKVLVA